jgi:hypothetical protein
MGTQPPSPLPRAENTSRTAAVTWRGEPRWLPHDSVAARPQLTVLVRCLASMDLIRGVLQGVDLSEYRREALDHEVMISVADRDELGPVAAAAAGSAGRSRPDRGPADRRRGRPGQ